MSQRWWRGSVEVGDNAVRLDVVMVCLTLWILTMIVHLSGGHDARYMSIKLLKSVHNWRE